MSFLYLIFSFVDGSYMKVTEFRVACWWYTEAPELTYRNWRLAS